MMPWLYACSKTALVGVALSALVVVLGSALTTSCQSPNFDLTGGEGGMGGEGPAPACDDRILNGDETGTDCGGPCAGCPIGEPCIVAADCEAPPDGDPSAVECQQG